MTLHNAFDPSPLPKTIKAAAFTSLTEAEVKALRSYQDANDPAIEPGEVFFYAPQIIAKDIEGDDFARHQAGSDAFKASEAAGDYKTNRRTQDNQLVWDGTKMVSQAVKKDGVQVMWLDPTVSPNAVKLVTAVAV